MNTAIPRNDENEDAKIRSAVVEAAFREGVSVQDWIDEAVADRAVDKGVRLSDLDDRDRREAILSRLGGLRYGEPIVEPKLRRSDLFHKDGETDVGDLILSMRRKKPSRSAGEDSETSFMANEFQRRQGSKSSVARRESSRVSDWDEEQKGVSLGDIADRLSSLEKELSRRYSGPSDRMRQDFSSFERDMRLGARAPAPMPETDLHDALRRFDQRISEFNHRLASQPMLGAPTREPVRVDSPRSETSSFSAPRGEVKRAISDITQRQRDLDSQRAAETRVRSRDFDDDASAARRRSSRPAVQDRLPAHDSDEVVGRVNLRGQALAGPQAAIGAERRDEPSRKPRRKAGVSPLRSLEGVEARLDELLAGFEEVKTAAAQSPASVLEAMNLGFDTLSKRIASQQTDESDSFDELDRRIAELHRDLQARLDTTAQAEADAIASLGREIDKKFEKSSNGLRNIIGEVAKKLGEARPLEIKGVNEIRETIASMEDRLKEVAENTVRESTALHQAIDGLGGLIERQKLVALRDPAEIQNIVSLDVSDDLKRIEHLVEGLSGKVEGVARQISGPADAAIALAGQVEKLVERIDAFKSLGVDNDGIDSIKDQIADLAARFEHADAGAQVISQMERSLDALLDTMAQAQRTTIDAACEAAREVAEDVLRYEPIRDRDQSRADDESDEDYESERRMQETLSAVHETLEKVVDRLTAVEEDVRRSQTGSGSHVSAAARSAVAAALADDIATSFERDEDETRFDLRETAELSRGDSVDDELIEPDERGDKGAKHSAAADARSRPERSDFIAAARRAIHAPSEASKPEKVAKDQLSEKADAKARARAAAARVEATDAREQDGRSKGSFVAYLSARKKTLIYGAAAVVLALCSLQVVSTLLSGGEQQSAQKPITPPQALPAPIKPAPDKPAAATHSGAADAPSHDATASLPSAAMSPSATIPEASSAAAGGGASFSSSGPAASASLPTFASPGPIQSSEVIALRSAAAQGDASAQYTLGIRYLDGVGVPRDAAAAADLLRKSANQNVPIAQYRLGVLYEKGIGLTRDVKTALNWYEKAANGGNVRAMHNLAVLSAEAGADGAPDYVTAAAWFLKAAQHGVRDSQYNLAILYARGLGVEHDLQQAYVWFAIAAQQGDADAASKRDELAARLASDQIDAAKAQVSSFKPLPQVAAANQAPIALPAAPTAAKTQQPGKSPSGV